MCNQTFKNSLSPRLSPMPPPLTGQGKPIASVFCIDSRPGPRYNNILVGSGISAHEALVLFFYEGNVMRSLERIKSLVFDCSARAMILCAFAFLFGGCGSWSAQPGETAAEGRRRHIRAQAINRQEMMEDIDYILLTDKPSKLTDKRIP